MATKAKRNRDGRTAAEVTLQHLQDADAVLSYLMHDTLERINAIQGSAVEITWPDAGDAERLASNVLDVLQWMFYGKADGDESKAREMALAAARLNSRKAFCRSLGRTVTIPERECGHCGRYESECKCPTDGGFVCASCGDRIYDANAATCQKCKGKQCAQCCRGTFLH